MSEFSRGWHDLVTFLVEPLFTIGETPMSLARLVATGLLLLVAWRAAGGADRSLPQLRDVSRRAAVYDRRDSDEPGAPGRARARHVGCLVGVGGCGSLSAAS